MWGSYGWTINPCTNVAMIFSKKVDKKSADLIALKQCSGQKMKQIFKFISENKRVKNLILKKLCLIMNINSINHVHLFYFH